MEGGAKKYDKLSSGGDALPASSDWNVKGETTMVKKLLGSVLAIVLLAQLMPAALPIAETSTIPTTAAQVISITDGDTIRVRLATGRTETVRFIGVNTPESTEPFGREATAFTTTHLAGRQIFLETDVVIRDDFGRMLAYVWLTRPLTGAETEVRTQMFNARLLLDGFATVMTISNRKYVTMFELFQQEARAAGRGLWALRSITIASVGLVSEEVILRNTTATSVDVSRWTLVSVVGDQRFVLPQGTVIPAGGSLVIVSGPGAMGGAGRLVWTTAHIWNNSGDTAALLNANGVEVSRLAGR